MNIRRVRGTLTPLILLLVTGSFALDRGLDDRTLMAALWAFVAGITFAAIILEGWKET